jgi:hypothetical protein
MFQRNWFIALFAFTLFCVSTQRMFSQADQGTITGIVQDPSGAVIANAAVTLTNLDQGQVLKTKTDGSGIYAFPSVRIGNYKVTATAPNFQTTTQTNLHLNIQQRLNVVVTLRPGAETQTVTVTTQIPLMQTQESSVGQTMNAQTINNVPLNGRNWVYIAQLAAGTTPPEGSRGAGKGDFNANGQRAEENNFILDGVDNNANVVDFFNGASYVVNPPPDALAEFKVQTSDYSAEFGHSAGAVVNASIKSGTNSIHGDMWEYVRNNDLGEATIPAWQGGNGTVPPYHQNIFGATLGGPLIKDKLFLFADTQANRVVFSSPQTFSVPSANERLGDFSELLNPTLLGGPPVQLYYQDPTGVHPPVPITNNCLAAAGTTSCPSAGNPNLPALNSTALKVLSEYPKPGGNSTAGLLYNNYSAIYPVKDDTFQWDARMDWNIGASDTAYSRYSYFNEMGLNSSGGNGSAAAIPLLGPILDGGGFGSGKFKNYGGNYMASETHTFSPTLINEARFGFNYLHTGFQQENATNDGFAQSQGFGGIPAGPLNGGLPNVQFTGTNSPHNFGAPEWAATDEHENVYQIIDNVTKIVGSQSLKAGVDYQNIRFETLQPYYSRGEYDYTGDATSIPGVGNTGYGVADFLLNDLMVAKLSNIVTDGDEHASTSLYFQDDWRVKRNLTVNLGLRWDYFQPYKEVSGKQASFIFNTTPTLNTTTGFGSVTGQYLIPSQSQAYASTFISKYGFDKALAEDNMTIVYDSNPRLQTTPKTNFAPRVGLSWSPDNKTVVRAGYGIFYGGMFESLGYWGNLGEDYPFQYNANFPSTGKLCGTNNCTPLSLQPNYNVTIANGFSTILANGFASVVTGQNLRGTYKNANTAYTQSWNLTMERSLGSNMSATLGYVGNTTRHLPVNISINLPLALQNPTNYNNQITNSQPLPHQGGDAYTGYSGMGDYHSLQAKLEKRMSHGYNLLATYTWSHAMDDAVTPLGSSGDGGYRQDTLLGIAADYANSPFDVRQRFTFDGTYDLPFGKGRQLLNQSTALDYLVGGWSANAMWVAQTGEYFTIHTSGGSNAGGFQNGPFAYQTQGEFATGGTPGTYQANQTCPTKTKTLSNWFNPCSYADPWDAGDATIGGAPNPHYIPRYVGDPTTPAGDSTPVYVTDHASLLGYAGGKRDNALGPGYERVNMSAFKDFKVYREQTLTFRADVFNLFNTPSWGEPTGNNSASGGQITSSRSLQQFSPDARFFQLALTYKF